MMKACAGTLVAAVVGLSILSAGCGGSPTTPTVIPTPTPTPPPASDSIKFVSVEPAAGTTLHRGQTVTFTGTVSYTLASADSARVFLVAEDQNDQPLQTATQPQTTVSKGSGQVTLSQSITLPKSGITTVKIFFPLAPTGAANTDTVVRASYPVQ